MGTVTRIHKERKDNQQWYFLSFRDPDLNRNLGCCNVALNVNEGLNSLDAKDTLDVILAKTRTLGINPGGEVKAYKVEKPELKPNKLYSRQEMRKLGYEF
ncbi:hypothetical protein HN695_07250 [Candidatus Woesearchaeota archaeon]|nr:hypothetical protein [Candidatus Woesearchaeota archaeon]MBT6040952.1 hypothetical protein [Candidatus Woesearchaeota archaeon]MBT6336158.1 hypothetical protein [Candidatus Woesearchaeota archaeon]MBT7928103.1 hypothetical protein [Candidatus Woesearchaeota archaeon]